MKGQNRKENLGRLLLVILLPIGIALGAIVSRVSSAKTRLVS